MVLIVQTPSSGRRACRGWSRITDRLDEEVGGFGLTWSEETRIDKVRRGADSTRNLTGWSLPTWTCSLELLRRFPSPILSGVDPQVYTT